MLCRWYRTRVSYRRQGHFFLETRICTPSKVFLRSEKFDLFSYISIINASWRGPRAHFHWLKSEQEVTSCGPLGTFRDTRPLYKHQMGFYVCSNPLLSSLKINLLLTLESFSGLIHSNLFNECKTIIDCGSLYLLIPLLLWFGDVKELAWGFLKI